MSSRSVPATTVRALLVAAAVVAALGACNRLTFVRPDMSRGDYTQTARVVEVRETAEGRAALGVQQQLQLAQLRLAEGNLAEARKYAAAALAQEPRSADAHTLLALVDGREGKAAAAGRHFAAAAELAPGGNTFNNYGTWLCGNGQAAGSLAWFDRALADPAYRARAGALANAGRCAAMAGQDGRAEHDLRAALAADPESVVALAAMAGLAFRQGDAFAARAFSQRRLAAGPADPAALQLASQIEHVLGDTAAAGRYTRRLQAEFGENPAQAQAGDQ